MRITSFFPYYTKQTQTQELSRKHEDPLDFTLRKPRQSTCISELTGKESSTGHASREKPRNKSMNTSDSFHNIGSDLIASKTDSNRNRKNHLCIWVDPGKTDKSNTKHSETQTLV